MKNSCANCLYLCGAYFSVASGRVETTPGRGLCTGSSFNGGGLVRETDCCHRWEAKADTPLVVDIARAKAPVEPAIPDRLIKQWHDIATRLERSLSDVSKVVPFGAETVKVEAALGAIAFIKESTAEYLATSGKEAA